MNQVGQHLGRTTGRARTASGRTPRLPVGAAAHRLVHSSVRDRDAATWLLAAVLTLVWLAGTAWALRAEATAPRPASAAVLLGGWSLTLLPVHCAGRFRRGARRAPRAPRAVRTADVTAAVPDVGADAGPAYGEGADRDESPPAPSGPHTV